MSESILVLNTGSSSIKFAAYERTAGVLGARCLRGQIDGLGGTAHFAAVDAEGARLPPVDFPAARAAQHRPALEWLLDWLQSRFDTAPLCAVGHRIVHGGATFAAPAVIDADVIEALQALIPIARLHQPYEIEAIIALCKRHPSLTQIACFDTAFHRTLPPLAQLFALPRPIIDSGVRRYGFHGLSYAYIATQLSSLLPASRIDSDAARVVVAHLGSGSSLCALRGGRSVATTMGFTALDGLMMATRAGSIDPGIVLYLLQERGMSVQEVSEMLYRRSGLLGVSGLSASMSELLASHDAHACEAVDLYIHCVVREAGALVAVLGGIDALVFTGGIGENAVPVRSRVCAALAWLGIEIDTEANARHAVCISTARSRVVVGVIATDEEHMIASETAELVRQRDRPGH